MSCFYLVLFAFVLLLPPTRVSGYRTQGKQHGMGPGGELLDARAPLVLVRANIYRLRRIRDGYYEDNDISMRTKTVHPTVDSSSSSSDDDDKYPTTVHPTVDSSSSDDDDDLFPPLPQNCNKEISDAPKSITIIGLPPQSNRCFAYRSKNLKNWISYFIAYQSRDYNVRMNVSEAVNGKWVQVGAYTSMNFPKVQTTLGPLLLIQYDNWLSRTQQMDTKLVENDSEMIASAPATPSLGFLITSPPGFPDPNPSVLRKYFSADLIIVSFVNQDQLPSAGKLVSPTEHIPATGTIQPTSINPSTRKPSFSSVTAIPDASAGSKPSPTSTPFTGAGTSVPAGSWSTSAPIAEGSVSCNVYKGVSPADIAITGVPLQTYRCFIIIGPQSSTWNLRFLMFSAPDSNVNINVYYGQNGGAWNLINSYTSSSYPPQLFISSNIVKVVYFNIYSSDSQFTDSVIFAESDAALFTDLELTSFEESIQDDANDIITISFTNIASTFVPSPYNATNITNGGSAGILGNNGTEGSSVGPSVNSQNNVKAGFEFNNYTIMMSILIFFASAFAADSRIVDAGLLFFPILVFAYGLSPQSANPLSQAALLGVALSTFVANRIGWNTPDPSEILDRKLWDYHALILLTPSLLIGTVCGVLFQIMAPAWFLAFGAFCLLLYGATLAGLETRDASDDNWIRVSKRDVISAYHIDEKLSSDYLEEEYEIVKRREKALSTPLIEYVFLIVAVVAFAILRGAPYSNPSIAGVAVCSTAFYALFAMQIPVFAIFAINPAINMVHGFYIKCQLRLNEGGGEIRWTGLNVFGVFILCLFIGFAGSIFGFGVGVMLVPLLVSLGSFKQVAYATTSFITLGTALTAGLNYLVLGMSDPIFQAWCLGLGVTGTLFGYFISWLLLKQNQKKIRYWVNISVIVAVLLVLVQALYLMTLMVINHATSGANGALFTAEFLSFCVAMQKYTS